ncbi:protein phosphatase PHLPP-like protein isoform X3 [Zootermopsis nevadensis]|uniref:Protein phosphatase PHLPP-like protein n=1 Tax=Zootermopsis nevadensis TaxID=136037 RepID=A0A067R0H2_ZOONE|nr:protein phosphatase PHLPP-like protein isoform X3 [Zootermopsis nevadensis]KDR16236.1 Protein phosphatase PHLPP-like protein [Zootermopsis nevadensis]
MDWLKQATQLESCSPRLDLSGEDLERLPESLPTFSHVQELHLGRNRLGDGNLKMLSRLPRLRSLHLPGNALRDFPTDLLQLFALSHLDLSNNSLTELPEEICSLVSLEELRVDRNALFRLPRALTRLQKLRNLLVGHNRLHELPGFLLAMKALTSLDFQGNQVENSKMPGKNETNSSPLGRVNLRANLLKGNIVLGNYGNLTQLDMSENRIETLDLSALNMLECVQCSRNQLTELSLSGKALVSLIAGNNRLQKLHINPPPTHLKHLDVSYNELESLPDWTASCYQLRALFASHNKLQVLPEHLFCSELSSLQTLQLSYNRLQTLPTVIRHIPLQELFLQSNSLATLPANFFIVSTRLRVLNLSNNRLCELPNGCHQGHQLEKLYLTANCLADNSLDILGRLANLHTLHAAYNSITTLPESCVAVWTELEELVISGNKLQHLPDNIIHLKHLRVLRIHSNCLQTIPCFAKMTSLKVLDLAHNCLDRVNLATLVPQQLQFLDLSCNSKLYVDPRQFQVYRSHRPMSLVDVSGQNRTCLPSTPYTGGGEDLGPPWKVGFSETAGQRERLYITQIRLPSFCNMEGLFGMFDGGNNNDIPNILTKAVPRMLLEERTVKETASEYMKYTMLSAHRELKETGQKYGVCGTLCHIVRTKPSGSSNFLPGSQHQYTMRVASVGEARAVLRRRSGLINLSQTTQTNPNHNQLGCSAMFPLVIPDPHVTEVDLEETDEFLIIANKRFWEVVSMEEAAQEIQDISNAILAAKRLQDLAQSYGSEENLSIMVVHFGNLTCTDVDRMLRELRHTVQKTKQQCCGNCCFGDGLHKQRYYIQNPPDADRSSPSGQSDHASSDCMGRNRLLEQDRMATLYKRNLMTSTQSVLMHENGTKKIGPAIERRSYRDSKRSNSGVLKAIHSKLDSYSNGHLADAEEEETGSDRSGTQVSEEQFKCWEYMLEQNTQLLFDKELDTLSRGFSRRGIPRTGAALDPLWPHPSTSLRHEGKALSRSSPHLSDSAAMPAVPFLSRHFGSARSFNPTGRTSVRFGSGRQTLNGGPNAAYFGSLQRLIPYNLEYNFSVIQERGANQDSLEQDGRMQQYWGVTTEL